MGNTHVLIALPTTGVVKTKTVFSLLRMLKQHPVNFSIATKESSILHWSREHLVKQALAGGCTHILFVDSDMFFEADSLDKLLKRDKDIIGAPYNLRQLPLVSTLKVHAEDGNMIDEEVEPGLKKVAAVGTGFLLIKTDVFKDLKQPWFFWESDENGEVVTGEDSWFCRLARQAGYDIYADLTVNIAHVGDYLY